MVLKKDNNTKVNAGIDIGSTTVKVVVLDEMAKVLYQSYERHFAKVREKAVEQLKKASEFLKGNVINVAIDYDPGATKINQENRIKLMLANTGNMKQFVKPE